MGAKPVGEAGEFARRLAARIEKLRDAAGLSNAELIRLSGLSTTYYYARLRGELPFNANDVEKLARGIGIAPEDIFTTATVPLIPVSGAELARRLRFLVDHAAAAGTPAEHSALVAHVAAFFEHFDDARWEALLEARDEVRVAEPVLSGIADFFNVPSDYLIAPAGSESVEAAEARIELASALRARGASTVAARSLAAIPPAQLRELARAISSPAEPGDD